MLKARLITKAPANTPIATPLFFVWKKDGTRHPVIDYRKLNDITIKDSFPLPCIDEMLEHMQGSKIFSKFNLKMGYHQLHMKPRDKWKATFMTPGRPFMPTVMGFGLCNAPPFFQCWILDVLTPVINCGVEDYLDNAGSHHQTKEEHVEVNCEVLSCFRKAGIFINAKKCKFHQDKMTFLGMDISQDGFEMEQVKVEMVQDWQPPKNIRAVREFIGFCNFYR